VFVKTRLKKLSTSLVVIAALLIAQVALADSAVVAPAKQEEKKKRPTQLVGASVGKKVVKAFESYTADDIDGALVVLKAINAKKDYDKAYVARFIAFMYASKENNEKEAIDYLKKAIAPDILNKADHGAALKLLADLQMQTKDYQNALANYAVWMNFTGEEDGSTWVKIAQAHYELKQLAEMIVPADKAIVAFGKKPNQNPYILKLTSFYERKKYQEAIKVLESVILIFPENKTWWTQLPMFYLLVENYPKAVQTLDLAYKQGFLDKASHIKTLANLYFSAEAPYKAAKLLEKHIASGVIKRNDQNMSMLANAWHAAQHVDIAAKYYGELAEMTSEASFYRKQGMLLKQDEQFSKAIPALEKALALGVENQGRLYMSIAESYFYLEKYKKAYVAIENALKDPKSRKAAKSWKIFIVDTARRKNISI